MGRPILVLKPVTQSTQDDELDRRANHIATHCAITIAMNVPYGMTHDKFVEAVIQKVRDKNGTETIQHIARRRGDER